MAADAPLLFLRGVKKTYVPRGLAGRRPIVALDGVEFAVQRGSTVLLIGESGSGKSTLAKCIAGLEPVDEGEIWFEDAQITHGRIRPKIQLVFQDPGGSLNPRIRGRQLLAEPLRVRGVKTNEIEDRSIELIAAVGLSSVVLERLPAELSGGQRARLAIARALAMEPSLIILDESFSALDFLTQSRLVELLRALQSRYRLSYLIISHEFGMLTELADEIAVMDEGRIIERATPAGLLTTPQQPRTRALVGAIAPRL